MCWTKKGGMQQEYQKLGSGGEGERGSGHVGAHTYGSGVERKKSRRAKFTCLIWYCFLRHELGMLV